MLPLPYEDLQSFENWLQTCGTFPKKIGDFDSKLPSSEGALSDEEIDRLLKEAHLIQASQINPGGKVNLSRDQKCLLGLQSVARQWKCGIECPAPWLPSTAPFVFRRENPSLSSLVRNCTEKNYPQIVQKGFPPEEEWKKEREIRRDKELKKFDLLEQEYRTQKEKNVSKIESQIAITQSQKTKKREQSEEELRKLTAKLGQIQQQRQVAKQLPLPDYKKEKDRWWQEGCELLPIQFKANLQKARKGFEQCEERIRTGKLLPLDFQNWERKEREKLQLNIQNEQDKNAMRNLTNQSKKEISKIRQLKSKNLSSKEKEIIQTYFQGLKRQFDRQQAVKENCMIKRAAGGGCFPEDEYRTLENWSSMNDLRHMMDLFGTRCPQIIASALRKEDYKALMK